MIAPGLKRGILGISGIGVAHRAMAAGAVHSLGLAVNDVPVNRSCDVLVATSARVFRHFLVEIGNPDGVGVAASSEMEGMPETVVQLHGILSDQVMRGVTVVAGGRMTWQLVQASGLLVR
jgi:hypothetical protein